MALHIQQSSAARGLITFPGLLMLVLAGYVGQESGLGPVAKWPKPGGPHGGRDHGGAEPLLAGLPVSFEGDQTCFQSLTPRGYWAEMPTEGSMPGFSRMADAGVDTPRVSFSHNCLFPPMHCRNSLELLREAGQTWRRTVLIPPTTSKGVTRRFPRRAAVRRDPPILILSANRPTRSVAQGCGSSLPEKHKESETV